MKSNKMTNMKAAIKAVLACVAVGWMCWSGGIVCSAQTAPSNFSPDLQEVVKLSQAHMSDDVIVNFIKSSGKSYRLNANDILYLSELGVSQGVISALQTASSGGSPAYQNPATVPLPTTPPPPLQVQPLPAPAIAYPPPPAPAVPVVDMQQEQRAAILRDNGPPAPAVPVVDMQPPAQEPSFDYFHDQLAPFGTWVNVGGVWYWHPDQAIAANPDWRPYYDMGQWVETDNGLFWQSDYTWGDIPFHYGRWVLDPVRGWLWAPDYTWGPSWVYWRHAEADGAIGWAPLPVGAVFVGGALMFNGVAVTADFDFGLGDGFFVFVGYDHFHEGFFRMRGHEYAFHVPRERVREFYGRSVIRNNFRRDEQGRFVNDGIGRDRIERLTRVEHSSFEERNPVGDRNKLAVQRAEEINRASVARPGEPRPGLPAAGPAGRPAVPAPVNKVFRPPTPAAGPAAPKPAATPKKP